MKISTKQKMLLLMAVGMLLPAGTIWLPAVVTCHDATERRLKKRLILVNTVVYAVCFAVLLAAMIMAMTSLQQTGRFYVPVWAYMIQLLIPLTVVTLLVKYWR